MASVSKLRYFVAKIKDEPGALLKVMVDLKARDIGLSGLWGFNTQGNKGELYVIAKDSEALRKIWEKEGMLVKEGMGFFISGPDRTGALVECLESLVKWGINIRAIDAIAIGSVFGSFIWVEDRDIEKASTALCLP